MQIIDLGKNKIIYGKQGTGKSKEADKMVRPVVTTYFDAALIYNISRSLLAEVADFHEFIIVDEILPEDLIKYISVFAGVPQQVILIVQETA